LRTFITRHPLFSVGFLLAAIAGGWTIDILFLDSHETFSLHFIVEGTVVAVSLLAIAVLAFSWWRARQHHVSLRKSEEEMRAERDVWKGRGEKLVAGLGDAISAQLRRWGLTEAERATALLLLKGCPHKEIASILGKSERTVRQNSVSVYKKSGLSGRAELSAFFLEDLLAPAPHRQLPDQEAREREESTLPLPVGESRR
jgi:DNA-binding CsgD family transcriptional regulator